MLRSKTSIAFREAQDAEIINANAGRLNREAMDVLGYQGLPVGPGAEPRAQEDAEKNNLATDEHG
jgi:hypothetical protein